MSTDAAKRGRASRAKGQPAERPWSVLECSIYMQLRALRLDHGIEREHRFDQRRRWRFDFAWPALHVALEVEGGTWSGGRHTRGAGFAADCEKYSRAAVLGWRVIRATGDQVKSGEAAQWVSEALAAVRSTLLERNTGERAAEIAQAAA